MRTKVLVGLAALAAGAFTAVAQSNVYSLNVVGYINLPLVEGFNLVANQLDADGTGTNNTISGVFSSNLPVNSQVYTWNGTGYNLATYAKQKDGSVIWTGTASALNPGMGAWVSIPTGSGAQTVTTVGQVLQGSLVNPNIAAAGGFNLVSSMVPLAGGITSVLNYNPAVNEQVYQWNGSGYTLSTYALNKDGTKSWKPSEPSIAVGQGFWLNTLAGSSWSNYFIVQ